MPAGTVSSGDKQSVGSRFRQIVGQAGDAQDQLITAEIDLDQVREIRDLWQFYRDRRPEAYGDLTAP